jgi:D-alanyl-D-alanine carboxypeptidase
MAWKKWIAGIAVVAGVGTTSVWAATSEQVDTPGQATAAAVRTPTIVDVVSVGEVSGLSSTTEQAAARIAQSAGGSALPTRGGSVGMFRLTRGTAVVQEPPSGYLIPMGVSVLPIDLAQVTMSQRVATVIAADGVVMGAITAELRSAQAGDVVELQAADGSRVSLTIGLVAPDAEVGGTELVVSPAVATRLGITTTTRVILWGFDSRAAFETAAAAAGFNPLKVRLTRSWDAPSPDSTLGMARTKKLLGEFAYRPSAGDAIDITPGWSDANIAPRATFADVPLRAGCHKLIVPAIQGALSEIASRGLAGEIDIANSNAVGGCFVPRMNRVTGNLGIISRHSWGQALDINVSQNPQGSIPKLNCDVVRIFREWGFAWGGNFTSLDGQHFEYVGERRDQFAYPSRFCPNLVNPTLTNSVGVPLDSRALLFADDGLASED